MKLVQARTCAICGESKNSSKGGIIAFELTIKFALEAGAKMNRPDSHYAHLGCMRKAQKQATTLERLAREAEEGK